MRATAKPPASVDALSSLSRHELELLLGSAVVDAEDGVEGATERREAIEQELGRRDRDASREAAATAERTRRAAEARTRAKRQRHEKAAADYAAEVATWPPLLVAVEQNVERLISDLTAFEASAARAALHFAEAGGDAQVAASIARHRRRMLAITVLRRVIDSANRRATSITFSHLTNHAIKNYGLRDADGAWRPLAEALAPPALGPIDSKEA